MKSRGVFRTQASINDGAFYWIYWTAYYLCNKSSIIEIWLNYMQASENIEIFKVKLSWSKLSWLLQRVIAQIIVIATTRSVSYFYFELNGPVFIANSTYQFRGRCKKQYENVIKRAESIRYNEIIATLLQLLTTPHLLLSMYKSFKAWFSRCNKKS